MAEMFRFDPLPDLHMSEDEQMALLQHVLPQAWDFASSTEHNWRPEYPERGQELATAAVLLDYCGGLVLERTIEQATKDGFTYSNLARGQQLFIRDGAVAVEPQPSMQPDFDRVFSLRHRSTLMDTYPKLSRYWALRSSVDRRMIEIDHWQERERQRQARVAAAS